MREVVRRVRRRWRTWLRDERGSVTVEVVALAFIPIMLLVLIVGSGRVAEARTKVTGAAGTAARAATLARTTGAAQADAEQVTQTSLGASAITCAGGPRVALDLGALTPGGQVRATITCEVSLSDLIVGGLPGSVTISQSAAEPVERYKAVTR